MKRRILAMLLSALLVANVCACHQAYENESNLDNQALSGSVTDNVPNTNEENNDYSENMDNAPPTVPSIDIEGESSNSDFSYTVTECGTVTIKNYYGNSSVLILPDHIDGKPVTKIDSCSFSRCDSL